MKACMVFIITFIVGVLLIVMKRRSMKGGEPNQYKQYVLTAHGGVVTTLDGVEYIKLPTNFIVVSWCKLENTSHDGNLEYQYALEMMSSSSGYLSNFADKLQRINPKLLNKFCVSSGNFDDINLVPNQSFSQHREWDPGLKGFIVPLPIHKRSSLLGLKHLQETAPDNVTISTLFDVDPRKNRQFIFTQGRKINPVLSNPSEYILNVEMIGAMKLFDIINNLSKRHRYQFVTLHILACQGSFEERKKTMPLTDYINDREAEDRAKFNQFPRSSLSSEIVTIPYDPKEHSIKIRFYQLNEEYGEYSEKDISFTFNSGNMVEAISRLKMELEKIEKIYNRSGEQIVYISNHMHPRQSSQSLDDYITSKKLLRYLTKRSVLIVSPVIDIDSIDILD